RLRSWKAHEGYIWSYEFSADGKTLVTGGQDKVIRFWDVATGQQQREITGLPKPVGKLALAADGGLLAAAGRTEEPCVRYHDVIRIWDVASGKELHQLAMPVQR